MAVFAPVILGKKSNKKLYVWIPVTELLVPPVLLIILYYLYIPPFKLDLSFVAAWFPGRCGGLGRCCMSQVSQPVFERAYEESLGRVGWFRYPAKGVFRMSFPIVGIRIEPNDFIEIRSRSCKSCRPFIDLFLGVRAWRHFWSGKGNQMSPGGWAILVQTCSSSVYALSHGLTDIPGKGWNMIKSFNPPPTSLVPTNTYVILHRKPDSPHPSPMGMIKIKYGTWHTCL